MDQGIRTSDDPPLSLQNLIVCSGVQAANHEWVGAKLLSKPEVTRVPAGAAIADRRLIVPGQRDSPHADVVPYHIAPPHLLGLLIGILNVDPYQVAEMLRSRFVTIITGRFGINTHQVLGDLVGNAGLKVIDVTPERIIQLLRSGRAFLEAQTDGWIRSLYEFLSAQQSLLQNLGDVPLLRLDNGSHVEPGGEIRAFLPGKRPSQFPTLRKSVCNSESSLGFLKSLGLREPHPVDDVIENVLPKYQKDEIDDSDYEADIQLIVEAHKSDESSRRKELIEALRNVKFVKAVDAGDGSSHFSEPDEVYLATGEQKNLFAGVDGVRFLDGSQQYLKNREVAAVLEDCGATPSDNIADVVIKHVLPKYARGQKKTGVHYEGDIECILKAYETIPNEQRFVLLNPLRNTFFVRSIDLGTGKRYWSSPNSVYLSTGQIKELLDGVPGVYMVDDHLRLPAWKRDT